jgi:hypothetical protein
MKVHRLTSSNMTVREYVEKQSDNEMLVMFLTSDVEGTARNRKKEKKNDEHIFQTIIHEKLQIVCFYILYVCTSEILQDTL